MTTFRYYLMFNKYGGLMTVHFDFASVMASSIGRLRDGIILSDTEEL